MSSTTLEQRIIERIQREGALTFAEYMRMALYEPGYGYYVTGAAKMGWEGDYYTSTDVSSFFAHSMGRQLRQMWEQLGKPTPFIVLEQGAGRGDLAQGVRSWVEREAPALHTALDYHTEDINAGQDAVKTTAPIPRPPARGGPTIYDTSAREAVYSRATPCGWPGGSGAWDGYHVILSNELVDAFPVHRVMVHERQLYEIYVDVKDGRLYEVLDEPGTPEVADYLDHYKIPWRTFPDDWQAEINLDALLWMQSTAGRLYKTPRATKGKGFLLIIDYGDKARALYTDFRYSGTLASYFRHQFTELPLTRPGEQDITAHVNFSALIEEGRHQGLRLHSFTTQREWLERMGIHEELDYLRKTAYAAMDTERATDRGQTALFKWHNLRSQVTALTDPTGMGNFKVLIMRS
jgi:SAM-dependent MidA family methyltransferase